MKRMAWRKLFHRIIVVTGGIALTAIIVGADPGPVDNEGPQLDKIFNETSFNSVNQLTKGG